MSAAHRGLEFLDLVMPSVFPSGAMLGAGCEGCKGELAFLQSLHSSFIEEMELMRRDGIRV